MSVIEKLEATGYAATDAQVEALAHASYIVNVESARTGRVYLRILLVAVQAKLNPGRRPPAATQVRAVNEVNARYYAAVLRGVTTPDIAHAEDLDKTEKQRRAVERNRRSVFARTAKATLVAYARQGDLRKLDAPAATKAGIRALMAPPEPTNRSERVIVRSQGALLRAITRQARKDPIGAQIAAEAALDALKKVLDGMKGKPVAYRRERTHRRPGRPAATVPQAMNG